MSHQMSFDFEAGPKRAAAEVKTRLNNQCGKILARLRQGPATNVELCAIGMKYNARISELRKAGFNVVCTNIDKKTGISIYSLREDCSEDEASEASREATQSRAAGFR